MEEVGKREAYWRLFVRGDGGMRDLVRSRGLGDMYERQLLTAASALSLAACVGGPPPEVATPVPVLPDSFLFAPEAPVGTALAQRLPVGDPVSYTHPTLATTDPW